MNQRQTNAVLLFLGFLLIFFTGYPILMGGYPSGGKLFDVVIIVTFAAVLSIIHYLIDEHHSEVRYNQWIIDYLSSDEGKISIAWLVFVMGGIIILLGAFLLSSFIFPQIIVLDNSARTIGFALISFGFALTVYSFNFENSVNAQKNHSKIVEKLRTIETKIDARNNQ